MAEHSRGPWIVTKRFQDKIDIHHAEPTKIGASSLVVARVTCRDTWREEQEANARLIAAAPDMLAALVAAVDCGMVPISSAKEGGAVTHSIQVRVADQIRDAIAKAKGEQP